MTKQALEEVIVYNSDRLNTIDVEAPFHPDQKYPEYTGSGFSRRNPVYDGVRELMRIGRYDEEHFGLPSWNPLGSVISPGQTVLLKPNLVYHASHREGEDFYSVVTHPAIIRCVIDYVAIALRGKGRIVIGDASLNNANFDLLIKGLGLDVIRELYAGTGIDISTVDFRMYVMEKDRHGVIRNQRRTVAQDEFVVASLDGHSALQEYDEDYKKFRVTEYDGRLMPLYHQPGIHQYAFHRSFFDADVVIALPKIKTHRKAGYTCALKNFVGLNANKDWLPHHRKGAGRNGGDEYLHPSVRKALISKSWDVRWKLTSPFAQRLMLYLELAVVRTAALIPFQDPFFEGSWWGNQTISRTIVDLNRIVIYADRLGKMQTVPQRRLLYFVDGIICGEGEGPMAATAKRCNTLVMGMNAYALDRVVVHMIGFDHHKIDTLRVARLPSDYPLFARPDDDILIRTNLAPSPLGLEQLRDILAFRFTPSAGWKGHIELDDALRP